MNFWHQTSSCKCSMCLYCVCKVSDCWLARPMYALFKHKHNPFKSKQGKKGQVHKAVILSIINFLAQNFFMQMFNVSILCRQNIRLFKKKAVVWVDWPVYELFSTSITHSKASRETMAKFTKLSFCQQLIFRHQMSSCKCSMCLYYVGKVSDCFIISCDTSWLARVCSI